MAFDDKFRLSVHAVITDAESKVLLLKATYGDMSWGLPGGALEPGETIHEALARECLEELGLPVKILYMSGLYYHAKYDSQAGVFRCELPPGGQIQLSLEHSVQQYFPLTELSSVQKTRVLDCLNFDGCVKSARFTA